MSMTAMTIRKKSEEKVVHYQRVDLFATMSGIDYFFLLKTEHYLLAHILDSPPSPSGILVNPLSGR